MVKNGKNNGKILLLEDYKPISDAYKDGLKRAGFEVEDLKNGVDVVKKIIDFLPDLILMDLIMPQRNGFEAIKDIKESEFKSIPIVVLSNLYQDNYIGDTKKLGVDDYLIKSESSMKEIIKRIKKHIKH